MVLLFLFGDFLPVRIVPPSTAIIGCSLALLTVYGAKIEPIDKVLNDIDWKTLVFLACMFCLVEALTKTGVLHGLSQGLFAKFGVDVLTVALVMLASGGLVGSVVANIPVVAAMVLIVKGYFVIARLVPEDALGATFVEWPVTTLTRFCGNDVWRNSRRQRDTDRRFSQYRLRRYRCSTRQTVDVRNFHALRDADHGLPAGRVCTLRVGALLSDRWSVTDLPQTAPRPRRQQAV